MKRADALRQQIFELAQEYFQEQFPASEFAPGTTAIPVSGRVIDAEDLCSLLDAALDMWLTAGRFAEQFERQFARCIGVRAAVLVNSGSSANLLAVSALTSPSLKDRRLQSGDEVITVAAGFPTTVNPIFQNGLRPTFVDVTVPTYNVEVEQLEAAYSDRTRAVMLAHTLGNPFDVAAVKSFVQKHDLWLIEDCCDAVGATYRGENVGTFGDLATVSFYPAHHITLGEGGCVLSDKPQLTNLLVSFRDWGRDCWCAPGKADTCGKRFDWQLGSLPHGYDHKYTYSHIGYNFKATDMQAALGVSQLKKLPRFIEARRRNFRLLYEGLKELEDVFVLPEATLGSNPSWFGFPLALRPGSQFRREGVIRYLEGRKIATRLLFGGNLVRQPAYSGADFRVVGALENSDFVMNNVFWVGVYPGLTDLMLDYIVESLRQMVHKKLCAFS
jgi:CDP-4-dehydro-6-deoxyglucose reductase, E1